jgi:hypothetical protein
LKKDNAALTRYINDRRKEEEARKKTEEEVQKKAEEEARRKVTVVAPMFDVRTWRKYSSKNDPMPLPPHASLYLSLNDLML